MDLTWLRLATTFLALVSICLNLTVAFFILFKSEKVPKSYRSLLFGYTIVRFCFGLFVLLSCPLITIEQGWTLIVYNTFPNKHIGFALLTLYAMVCIMITISMTFSYMYRYVHTCRKDYVIWFQMPRYFIVMCSLYAVIGCSISSIFYGLFFNDSLDAKVQVLLWFAGRLWALVCLTNFVHLHHLHYDVYMFRCSYRINISNKKSLQKSFETQSPKMKKMKKNLVYMLITQIVLYIFCWHVPIQTSFIASIARFCMPWITIIVAVLLPFTQVLEPVIIFKFIGNYNNYINGIFAWNSKSAVRPITTKSTMQF